MRLVQLVMQAEKNKEENKYSGAHEISQFI